MTGLFLAAEHVKDEDHEPPEASSRLYKVILSAGHKDSFIMYIEPV